MYDYKKVLIVLQE